MEGGVLASARFGSIMEVSAKSAVERSNDKNSNKQDALDGRSYLAPVIFTFARGAIRELVDIIAL